MIDLEKVQVFASKFKLNFIGTPIVVSAQFFEQNGDCYCERYFFVMDGRQTIFIADDPVHYPSSVDEDTNIPDATNFLKNIVVTDAASFANTTVYLFCEKNNIPAFGNIEMINCDGKKQLTDLWLNGKHKEELEAIQRESRCSDLRQMLSKILIMPHIKNSYVKA